MSTPKSELAGELEGWWKRQAHEEIERTVPKAVEYGSGDLTEIGRKLVEAGVGGDRLHTVEELNELGLYFYLVGKFARWASAIEEGRRVSDDTLFDIGVYVRMAQRNREVGGWPSGPKGHVATVRLTESEAKTIAAHYRRGGYVGLTHNDSGPVAGEEGKS